MHLYGKDGILLPNISHMFVYPLSGDRMQIEDIPMRFLLFEGDSNSGTPNVG